MAPQNHQLDEIKTRLSYNLTSYFPELSGNLTLKLTAVAHRRYSSLYFFNVLQNGDLSGCPRGLAVKLFAPQSGGLDAAQRQYDALTSIWPAFKNSPTLSIPRPLDFFPELSALVSEKVSGESLQQRYRTWPIQKAELLRYNRGAGQWLKTFHSATVLPAGCLDVDNKLELLNLNLACLKRLGFSNDICRQLKDCLSSWGKQIANVDLEMASVHGDFTVDNLLVEGDGLIAIDLGGRDCNAIYHDLTTYLNSLLLLPLSWPVSGSLLVQSRDAFLAGYFDGATYNRSAVQFLRLIGLVSVAVEILERRRKQLLAGWWVRAFFKRAFRRMIEETSS